MIDLSTLTCLPGLIDVHTHLRTNTSGYADVDVKRALDGGVIPGPRMQVATRALNVVGQRPMSRAASSRK